MRRLALFLCLLALCGRALGQDVADVEEEDDEYADSQNALLVAHKQCLVGPTGEKTTGASAFFPTVVQGKNVTVEALLYNGGTSTAVDVAYKDVLPEGAELVGGSLTAHFPRIAPGSTASHSYVVRFTAGRGKSVVQLPQASVSYIADAESTVQTGRSSKAGIFVLTALQQLAEWGVVAGRYATLSLVRTEEDWTKIGIFVGVVGGLLGANWLLKQVSTSRQSSQRKRALKQLQSEAEMSGKRNS